MSVEIQKDGGFYYIWVKGVESCETTLEHALISAIQASGITGVELAPTLQAAEVLESLLGSNG
jgi:hypothetical protein